MVKFTIDQVRAMMNRKENIRNMSVIAHVDHGKSTLTDSLVAKAGIIAEDQIGYNGGIREDEKMRGITIKASSVSLFYERVEEKGTVPYLINLIDSPGHIDFSSEVTAALRVTDGALVVVDCVEGVCVQTETVLRQAIAERIRPVLWLNKLDRVFLELNLTYEECYKNFRNSIESVNVICKTYEDEKLGNIELLPTSGTVGFGSGLHAWGFTLDDFAKMYASRFGLSVNKMRQKLWGENFWDAEQNEWVTKNPGNLQRSFCQFVLHPIKILFDAVLSEKAEVLHTIMIALRLKMNHKDTEAAKARGKDMLKLVMRTWIPAGDALFNMIVDHLPSPVVAQKYRCEVLYTGPLDSAEAQAVRECDQRPEAPTSMYVSKMMPTSEKGRFIAYGRVFSGVIKTGQEIRILGPEYKHGEKTDLVVKRIQRTLLMMGRYVEQIPDCPAGNVCGVMGIDQFLVKSGTLTTSENFWPFQTMKFSVAAVVQQAVELVNASDLPKLVEGLKRLAHADSLVKISTTNNGQHIIAGAGALHMEICLKDLREYMNEAPIKVSEPIVSLAESISEKSGYDDKYPHILVSKAPNKLNRLYVSAEPLGDKFVAGVESGDIKMEGQEMKVFASHLADKYGWDKEAAKKIWCFGSPPDAMANVVVDMTKGVQHMNEIRDHVRSAFRQFTMGGLLCDETVRGCRFDVQDAKIHPVAVHRSARQMIPCAKRVFLAAQMASGPIILEPLYLVEITVHTQKAHSGVFNTLSAKRGEIESITEHAGTNIAQIRAYLPVLESFDFTELLRKNTGGHAFPQMKFSHWQPLKGDPLKEGSQAYLAMMDVRKRKGLTQELPVFSDYYDKIT